MKIAIIGNNLRVGGGTIVMLNLFPALLKKLSKHEVLVALPFPCEFEKDFPNVKFVYPNSKSSLMRLIWQKMVLEPMVRKFKPEWSFMAGNYAIKSLSGRQAMLMHNPNLCQNLDYKNQSIGGLIVTFLRRYLSASTQKYANSIYFQTSVPQKMYIDYHKIDPARTKIIPLSVPSDFTIEEFSDKEILQREKFVLGYVANPSELKNHTLIVDTFIEYKKELTGVECIFTFKGNESILAQSLYEKVQKNNLSDSIKFIGNVNRDELKKLYRRMDALVMPTRRETLGLPYLESMCASVPIITTDADFTRAVCGDAAEYINNNSTKSLLDAILKLKNSLSIRKELVALGFAHLKKNAKTWDEIADYILEEI